MKKIISLLLSVLLTIGIFTPISAFAASDGGSDIVISTEETEIDGILEKLKLITVIDLSKLEDDEEILSAVSVVYCSEGSFPMLSMGYKNMSYNAKNNTLTLSNVDNKYLSLGVINMGEDFKIKLKGYNELSNIESVSYGNNASVTLTGNGEIVLNREGYADAGISVMASNTPSFVHAEKDVNIKIHATYNEYFEEYTDSVEVWDSTILDANKLIALDGKFSKKPKIESYEYTEYYYEQLEAYDYDTSIYELSDAVFSKKDDDTIYAGFQEFDYDTFDYTGKYYIIPVVNDNILGGYASKTVVDFDKLKAVDPAKNGYTMVMNGKNPKKLKNIFIAEGTTAYNLAVASDGTQYGFEKYDYGDGDISYTVYDFIEHPTFGLVAKESADRYDLTGLTPKETGSQTLMSAYIENGITMNKGGTVLPSAATLVSAVNAKNGVKITWKTAKNATKYRVYRKADGEKSWTALTTLDGASTTSYTDTTAKSGKKYTYTVKSGNIRGWGSYDKKGVSVNYIAAPKVTLKSGTSGMSLKWSKVAGAKQYAVYKKAAGAKEWTKLGLVSQTSYTDKNVKNGQTYTYAVKAVNGKVYSGYTPVQAKYISAPKLVSAQNAANGVNLEWKKVSGVDGYKVYRKTGSGSWEYLGKTKSSVLTYTDTTAKSGKTYSYTVLGYSGSVNGAYDRTGLSVKYLSAPATSVKSTAESVSLSWKAVSGAKEYIVYKRADGEKSYTKLATTTKLSYNDKNVKSGTTYYYVVKASDGKTRSSSKTVKQMFLSQPTVTAKASTSGVNVSWKKVNGAAGYRVYRKTADAQSWTRIATVDSKTLKYTDENVAPSTTYQYTVKAYNGSYNSSYNSAGVSVKTAKAESGSYILNTETMKIHKTDCSHIDSMNEENKQAYTGEINKLIAEGYTKCGTCFK